MQLQCLVRHLKIHLSRHLNVTNRENCIVLSTMVVFLLPFLIYIPDYGYYTHYIVGFANTLLFLILLDRVLRKTHSIRLFGLLVFLGFNMSMDLLSIISSDVYWMLKGIRYEDYINFRNGFIAYEIICVFWKRIKGKLAACIDFIDRVVGRNIHKSIDNLVCGFRIWLVNNLQIICSHRQVSHVTATA